MTIKFNLSLITRATFKLRLKLIPDVGEIDIVSYSKVK